MLHKHVSVQCKGGQAQASRNIREKLEEDAHAKIYTDGHKLYPNPCKTKANHRTCRRSAGVRFERHFGRQAAEFQQCRCCTA